jgi:class 3 adenylate cyclase
MASAGYEHEGFAQARALARQRRRRILLPLAVVAIMLLALIGIAIHNYWAMRADALALSAGVITNLRERIETEVAAYLRPINGIVQLSRDLLEDKLAAGIPSAEVEALGVSMLANAPQLTALFVGSRDGEFVMVRREQRDGKPVLETKWIRRSERAADGFEIRYTRRDEEGRVVSQESAPWDRYDPRTRPWYQGAEQDRRLHWTEVYPFFTDRAAGITASVPVPGGDGALRAAIGADVTLTSISRFLASLSIGKSGQAMIVDAQGQLIAHPRAELVREEGNGKLRLSRIEDIDDPVVRRAYDYYRVEHFGHRDFELDGRRYISSVSSLDRVLNRDWSVLLVVPEDDFVGFVGDNVRKTLVMGLSTMALAGLFAWLLIRQGLRTDRQATRVLEREAELEAEAKAFGQLASASVSLDPGAAPALRPFTESASEAARVRRVSIWHLAPEAGGLVCLDCYDRDTGGHTHGTRLARQDYPELLAALEAEPLLAAVDAGDDVRLASLARMYLQPLGCRGLLAVPVKAAERLQGAVLLEDTGQRVEWAPHTAAFARALANLLAVGAAGAGATAPATAMAASEAAATNARARPHPKVSAAFRDLDVDTTLGERRAAAFVARLSSAAGGAGGVEVVEHLAVLSLQFTDSVVLAQPTGRNGAESTVAQLLDELQAAARDEGVSYLKFFSDQVIASVDPNEDASEALGRLAEFALRVKAICETLFARHRAALAFRIGIDLGPAVASLVGRDNPAFAFWGDSVRSAMRMADSSFPGAIQVTESAYQLLRSRYVLQLRGHHYLEGLGEFSTYMLGGKL